MFCSTGFLVFHIPALPALKSSKWQQRIKMEGQLKIVRNPLGLFFLTIEELYRKSAKCLNRSGKRTEFGESFGASCRCLMTTEIEAKQFQILRFSNYRIIRKDAPGSQLKEIYDIFVQQTMKRGEGGKES